MLCDHVAGWNREGGGEGDARGKRYGDICICITDSVCYKAETNKKIHNNNSRREKELRQGTDEDEWQNVDNC